MTTASNQALNLYISSDLVFSGALYPNFNPVRVAVLHKKSWACGGGARSSFLPPIKAMESPKTTAYVNGQPNRIEQHSDADVPCNDCDDFSGKGTIEVSTVGNSSNIAWHKCSVEKSDRQELLNQKGCVIWITGLSGSDSIASE